jgi:MFS family permease
MFIASVAFPAMAHAFNTTPSALAWVSNGYIAGLTLVIPFSSLLSRRIGQSASSCSRFFCSAQPPLRRACLQRLKV